MRSNLLILLSFWYLFGLSAALAADQDDATLVVQEKLPSGEFRERGSGFVFSPNGFILTAKHVVEGLASPHVSLRTRNSKPILAEPFGCDNDSDICILHIDAAELSAANITEFPKLSCRILKQGETIRAVGFATDSPRSSVDGKITTSELGNVLKHYMTAGVFEGMSGGPIYDSSNKVVGIAYGAANAHGAATVLTFFTPLLFGVSAISRTGVECGRGPADEASSLVRRADTVLADNPPLAADLYKKAIAADPENSIAWYGLSRASFAIMNYHDSFDESQKAFELSNPKDLSLLLGRALSAEGFGDLHAAKSTYASIISGLPNDSGFRMDASFSLGQIDIKLARGVDQTSREALLSDASTRFSEFIKNHGYPVHFAYYHLACIAAMTGDKAQTKRFLAQSILELANYPGERQSFHKRLLRSAMKAKPEFQSRPGYPVPCPELAKYGVGLPLQKTRDL